MLERYLLSTLTSKFGHVFEGIDESTQAELSAWRGVLALRNLRLRKDALRHLGVPSATGGEGEGGAGGHSRSGDGCGDDEVAVDVPGDDDARAGDDGGGGELSDDDDDDDSFVSCASRLNESYGQEASPDRSRTTGGSGGRFANDERPEENRGGAPAIEVVHGSIGSLELHIPWKLLRATRPSAGADGKGGGGSGRGRDGNKLGERDDGLLCSAVLSDVRVLLAASNHSRNRSRNGSGPSDPTDHVPHEAGEIGNSIIHGNIERQELEQMRKERELAVQSLLEAEILRMVRGINRDSDGWDNAGNPTDGTKSAGQNAVVKESRDGWLSSWAKGLVARILSNLTVTIQNIHVRYEDEGYGWFDDTRGGQRCQYRPAFAVGIRLGEFSIRNGTAEDDMPAGSLDDSRAASDADAAKLRRKTANVEQLSVYWDSSHPDLFVGYPTEEDDRIYYENRFAELDILSSDDFEGGSCSRHHSYLIEPISPSLELTVLDEKINRPSAPPSIHASLCLPSCLVGFDRGTLEDASYVRKCLSSYKSRVISARELLAEQRISRQLSGLRPNTTPRDSPRLWWQYAIKAIISLRSNKTYFEGKSNFRDNARKWRRRGWLGFARLLRLRNEYATLYESLYTSSTTDKETVHMELVALEDLLNNQEIAAFRISTFTGLSNHKPQMDVIPAQNSLDIDELALGSLSVISLEYREAKLCHIVQSIDSHGEVYGIDEEGPEPDAAMPQPDAEEHPQSYGDRSPMFVFSVQCQEVEVQCNDTSTNNMLDVTAQSGIRKDDVPILRLQCMSSFKYEKFHDASWNLSCTLSSLTVSDLITPYINKSREERTLIKGKNGASHSGEVIEHTASFVIRNVATDDAHSTTYFNVDVSPLHVTYSTNAFEALSRLFAAIKTPEWGRDYLRMSNALSRWQSSHRKRLLQALAAKKKIVLCVDVAAPVVLIPEDLQNADSSALVIHLGRLTLRSDSRDDLPLGFDDKWLLRIDEIKASCIQQKPTAANNEHAIVEPFSLQFSVLTHIAEGQISANDVTKIDVQASLPQLYFNLTTSAVRVVSRLQSRWNYAKLRNPQRITQHTNIEDFLQRRSSLRQNIIQDLANDVPSSESTVTPIEIAGDIKQELKFSFSSTAIALQIGNDVGFDKSAQSPEGFIPLLTLSLNGFHGTFSSFTTEDGQSSHFSASIRSVHAKDIQKSGTRFLYFLSSVEPIFDDSSPDLDMGVFADADDDDLVSLEIVKETSGDQVISINFHELYVEWNPELLARIQKSLRLPSDSNLRSMSTSCLDTTSQASTESDFFDALDTTECFRGDLEDNGEVTRNEVEATGNRTGVKKLPPKFKVLFHLSTLRVNFNKDSQSRCLFTAMMSQTDISFCRKPEGGSRTTATVAHARLKDADGTSDGTLYSQLIGLQTLSSPETSIVTMSFETFLNSEDSEYHNILSLKFSPMKFVYIQQLWLEIFDYFFEGILGHAVWGTRAKPSVHYFNPADATRAFRRTKMSIELSRPLLLLPLGYRSPQHIRLQLSSLEVSNNFIRKQMKKKEGALIPITEWSQWFNNAKLQFCDLDVQSWDERALTELSQDELPPSLMLDVRWPVGPTTPLVKPKWNVSGQFDPITFTLSQKDFSLFRFFVNYNLLEPSRFLSKDSVLSRKENFVLYGYEKVGVPPTTYSIQLSTKSLEFRFILDEQESQSKKSEGMGNVKCMEASWSLVKNADDYITRQKATVGSIILTQTSKNKEWAGYPDLLLPVPTASDPECPDCLLHFTSTTHPNGNNVKTLNLDGAGIYLILPAWRHVGEFFTNLPTSPEVFARDELPSIMQVGDRFYRMSKQSAKKAEKSLQDDTVVLTSSRQFLLSLTSPQIILVADSTRQKCDDQCVTLSMANMNLLRKIHHVRDEEHTDYSVVVDRLQLFTGTVQNGSPLSSLLCPLSFTASMAKIVGNDSARNQTGWVWLENIQARATYTDLIHTLTVLNGIQSQIATGKSVRKSEVARKSADIHRGNASVDQLDIDFLCDKVELVITDDSCRQFANAQSLVGLSLTGVRFHRRVGADPQDSQETNSSGLIKRNFASLDTLELADLLQSEDSSFRVMTSGLGRLRQHGVFSFSSPIEVDAMTWQSYKVVHSDSWGYQISQSMKQRHDSIQKLTQPSSYFDSLSKERHHFFAFKSVLHEKGLHIIDTSVSKLNVQWNPSTVIAVQRFLGRLKKAAISILTNSRNSGNGSEDISRVPAEKKIVQQGAIFSVNVNIEYLSIHLNKEYQHRRLLDTTVTDILLEFQRYDDKSLRLSGSIETMRAWDPDTSKPTSDRNRRLLDVAENTENTHAEGALHQYPFFAFCYRTFRTSQAGANDVNLPAWITSRISGGIDDCLTIKMKPLEFNYCGERTAELADYLNNGLPGKGMGATYKGAQTFCEERIRTRSFLDMIIEKPRLYIPRAPSSTVGGCYLSLGNVTVKSWFEEAHKNLDDHTLTASNSFTISEVDESSEMDWWRVLEGTLEVGVNVEVDHHATISDLSNPDTSFQANFTMHKPSTGKTTFVKAIVPSLNIHLKYREFLMIGLINTENMVRPDQSQWDNVEKSYWQDELDMQEAKEQTESNIVYAESARFVRFGETKASGKSSALQLSFLVDSIGITLHRDDWYAHVDEESATLLCYDSCEFAVHGLEVIMAKKSNGNKSTSINVSKLQVTDVGDMGRLARDIYIGNSDRKRAPCAFSVVAEGYGESSQHDPLVSLTIGTQSQPEKDPMMSKNIDLKLNSLTVTILPRVIDEVASFLMKKWTCPNSNLEIKSSTSAPSPSSRPNESVTPPTTANLRFKFLAVYPRLILLADESDPFSRGLVLRGFAVGHVNTIREEASLVSTYGQNDARVTTTLNGHVKELETYVHNDISALISNPNDAKGVALIEPVTVTAEIEVVARDRFPTSQFMSLEIEPFATMISFSDINLIETVIRKSSKNKKEAAKVETHLSPMSVGFESYFSKSSDYSECNDGLQTLDVVMLTKKLGLELRLCDGSVIIEQSLTNPNIHANDVIVAINGQNVQRMPLPSIVDLFEKSGRPLTLTISRSKEPLVSTNNSMGHRTKSRATETKSNSFDINLFDPSSDNEGVNTEGEPTNRVSPTVHRFNLTLKCGMQNGLELQEGIGGCAVVNSIDYDILRRSMIDPACSSETKDICSLIASKQLPLPGSIVLAVTIDGDKEAEAKEVPYAAVAAKLNSCKTCDAFCYKISFVEAESSSWGKISKLEGKVNLELNVIDDTNGKDMPILRAGLEGSFDMNQGILTRVKSIKVRRPALLTFGQKEVSDPSLVSSFESSIATFSLEYNNAIINQWEPIIEPHFLRILIERQSGTNFHPGKCAIEICDQINTSNNPSPSDYICINVSDSAVDVLGKAYMNWKRVKTLKSKTQGDALSPPTSPNDKNCDDKRVKPPASSAAELRKATKLAKNVLDFTRKRGPKTSKADTANSPFVIRNRTGSTVTAVSYGMMKSSVSDGESTQLKISSVSKVGGRYMRKHDDNRFPTINVKLEIEEAGEGITADAITLPTDKVGKSVLSVCIMKNEHLRNVPLLFSVELEDNRRVLTLTSATHIKLFGCGSPVEVGVRPSGKGGNDVALIGLVVGGGSFAIPIWVESCFCEMDVFIRPSTKMVTHDSEGGEAINVYGWSASPVLQLKKDISDPDNTGVMAWATDAVQDAGGVFCPLSSDEEHKQHHPVWLNCTFSSDDHAFAIHVSSALSIRNLLPCNIEWEVAKIIGDKVHTIDSSFERSSSLQRGGAVEVFAESAVEDKNYCAARFKIKECQWSEWLDIQLMDGSTVSKTFVMKCKADALRETSITFGAKLSTRELDSEGIKLAGGFGLILFAEVWLRNMTSLPLTFGAPSLQVRSDDDITGFSLRGKVSAESAITELLNFDAAVLEGMLPGSDNEEEDVGDDILNLPLQQEDSYFEEIFEYITVDATGNVEQRWYASDNHVSLREKPKADLELWSVDCAGEPLLVNGWESCSNMTKAFTGQRVFDKRHRFRRRRLFRHLKTVQSSNGISFHQPVDLDGETRLTLEAERNAIGVNLDEKKESNLLDAFSRPYQQQGVLDIMSNIANDGSIIIHVKLKDGKYSAPAIIPPTGSANGVLRVISSRWPRVTKAMKHKQKRPHSTWANSGEHDQGLAPLEPNVYELIYQVTVLTGLWDCSRIVTIAPRFIVRNDSAWLDIDVKQVGAPDIARIQIRKGDQMPFYWCDMSLPELICVRPTQTHNRYNWSGGFDLLTLGMCAVRLRRIDGSIDQLNLTSVRVNVELQPKTGGCGTLVTIRDEDPSGEGALFRIENHSPFSLFVSQDGVLANPLLKNNGSSLSCDEIKPGDRTSYALDVPWRQGKYASRSSATMAELLLLRCALAPLSTKDGVESTKVISFSSVGDFIRLSPYKLSAVGSLATELLGVRVLGVVATDGPTRTLRFVLMQKEVTTTSYIGNAALSLSPMPSFMSVDSAPQNECDDARTKELLDAVAQVKQLINKLPNERQAAREAFFGTGVCSGQDTSHFDNTGGGNNTDSSYDVSCKLTCSGFIFSVIDASPTELAAISLHNVRSGVCWNSLGKEYASGNITIGWFQVDNHLPNAVYPVAMRPKIKASTLKEQDNAAEKVFTADKSVLEAKLEVAPMHRTGIRSLSAGASLHDVEIFLDLAFLLRVQSWWLGINDHILNATGARQRPIDSQENWDLPKIEHLIKRRVGSGQHAMYFQRLTILPCKVALSVAPVRALARHQEAFEGPEASAIHAAVRKGDVLVGEGNNGLAVKVGSQNRTAISVVQGMLKSILVDALLRCDGASLDFEGVALFHHTSNNQQLMTYLGAHYLASLIANVPALIGSLAAIGNPLGLMRGLGDGVSDFVNEPVRGFKRSIEEMDPKFAISGVARGTGSLARHTVGGFADSASLLTQTVATNMAVLTLDRKYAQRRDRLMKLKVNDAKSATILRGLESGVQKLISGILEGVTGVVSKPIIGAERSGVEGFAKGVGKGLLGLIVKPVIGTADLVADTLIGVKGSVEGSSSQVMTTLLSQVRPRRALYGSDRLVKPFRLDDATAATIQSKLPGIGGEEYLTHVDMVTSVALMSVNRLLVLSSDGIELLLLPFSEMKGVDVQEGAEKGFVVRITLLAPKSDSEYVEVNCDEECMAVALCDKLSSAIKTLRRTTTR